MREYASLSVCFQADLKVIVKTKNLCSQARLAGIDYHTQYQMSECVGKSRTCTFYHELDILREE